MDGISEVEGKRKKARPPRGAARRSIHSHPHSHPFEVRHKAAQLYLEEGFSPELIARQMGVGKSTLSKWVRLYRDHGEAGLKSKEAGPRRRQPKVGAAVKTKVVELKRRHPDLVLLFINTMTYCCLILLPMNVTLSLGGRSFDAEAKPICYRSHQAGAGRIGIPDA